MMHNLDLMLTAESGGYAAQKVSGFRLGVIVNTDPIAHQPHNQHQASTVWTDFSTVTRISISAGTAGSTVSFSILTEFGFPQCAQFISPRQTLRSFFSFSDTKITSPYSLRALSNSRRRVLLVVGEMAAIIMIMNNND
jgi:hypothetical protein